MDPSVGGAHPHSRQQEMRIIFLVIAISIGIAIAIRTEQNRTEQNTCELVTRMHSFFFLRRGKRSPSQDLIDL